MKVKDRKLTGRKPETLLGHIAAHYFNESDADLL